MAGTCRVSRTDGAIGSPEQRRFPGSRGHRALSRQFGLTSAPIVPHFVHTMRGPKDGIVMSPGRWSTLRITSCRHCLHMMSSERTPFSRMFATSIGTIGSVERGRAISSVYDASPMKKAPASAPRLCGPACWGAKAFGLRASRHRERCR